MSLVSALFWNWTEVRYLPDGREYALLYVLYKMENGSLMKLMHFWGEKLGNHLDL